MTRTRFAPSPTGKMHIGNLKAALYEYLIAKSSGGKFVLRIEDTDRARFVEGAEKIIYETLRVAGIKHDEGPDVGGGYGPYVQSERQGIYKQYALELIEGGKAYYCFCTKERLEGLSRNDKTDAVKYDRHCWSLSPGEIAERLEGGEQCVIRQLIPEGAASFTDEVFGEITIDADEMDDQVLIKSDGFPTYNFANVVDDHLMAITHVVRGSEYLTSTPKYNCLYDAFGWEKPKYVHLPLLLNESGEKFSKRRGDASFQDLLAEGFLPQAVVNYVALLGWAPKDNTEIFTIEELERAFDIKGLSKSPSKFDRAKLLWVNSRHIQALPKEEFAALAAPYINFPPNVIGKLAEMAQTRVSLPSECAALFSFLAKLPEYDIELYTNKKMKTDAVISKTALAAVADAFANISGGDWNNDGLYRAMTGAAEKLGYKNSQTLWPVRIALSGQSNTPCGGSEIAELLGREETVSRLKDGLAKLESNSESTI